MIQRIRVLLPIMLALCLVQGASAADFVENFASVNPESGNLAPGEQVIVHVIVRLTGSGDNTFDTNDELEAYTELDDPEWEYTIFVNKQGIPKATTNRYVRLPGWDLAYPTTNDVIVDYTLVGNVPVVPMTSDIILFRLRQQDANSNVPSGGEILIKPPVIVNPETQFVTAATSSAAIAKGDNLYITGTTKGNSTENVSLWIFGEECASYAIIDVDQYDAFGYMLTNTVNLETGRYYVILQHPMNNTQFDLVPQAGNPAPGQAAVVRPILDAQLSDPETGNLPPIFIIEGTGKLQGCDAANALVDAINGQNIDDTYYEISFMIEEPWVRIDAIDDAYLGENFTITGTTNLASGDSLTIEIVPLTGGLACTSGTTLVVNNDEGGENTWEFAVDTSSYIPDEYIVAAKGGYAEYTSTQYFTILQAQQSNNLTITLPGDTPHYLGDEIIISGINTVSNFTWLFITGPNLPSKGSSIEDPSDGVNSAANANGVPVSPFYPDGQLESFAAWRGKNVENNDTWEYTWDTTDTFLDAGTYTIYAVTTATNQKDLAEQDTTFATATIVLNKPCVIANVNPTTIAQGDDIHVTGDAYGSPSPGVGIWILGKYYASYANETVNKNGTFAYHLTNTTYLAAGQYFAIIQHPMYNDQFDLAPQANNPAAGQIAVVRPIIDAPLAVAGLLPPVFILKGSGSLQGSDAATALVNEMNSPDIDDTYNKLTFMVEESWTIIDPIGERYAGETFTISGTTNLAAGNNLSIEVTPLATAVPVTSGSTCVSAGAIEGQSIWEFTVDTSSYTPGKYIVTVGSRQTITQTFTILPANQNPGITINPIQNGPYHRGEDVLISGTNNESDTTWLFICGPGLPDTGGSFRNPSTVVNSATNANGLPVSPYYPDCYLDSGKSWQGVSLAADHSWECTWKTPSSGLEAGTYTIYAVTTATDKGDLSSYSASYAIASVSLDEPYITATTSSSVLVKGDNIDLEIIGNAFFYPTESVALWIFDAEHVLWTIATVDESGTFGCIIENVSALPVGQYFIVAQHPMANEAFDLICQTNNPSARQSAVVRPILDAALADPNGLLPPLFILEGDGSLHGADAFQALVSAMNDPEIDDTCFRLSFSVEEPWIQMNALNDQHTGENFTITGTTNLAIGDMLEINITKTQDRSMSYSSGEATVTASERDGINIWEYIVDASSFTPGEYTITIVRGNVTENSTFNVLQTEPSPTPYPPHNVTITISAGWNLISTPVDAPLINTSASLYQTAYTYNTTSTRYEAIPLEELKLGEAYWVGAFETAEITFSGTPLTSYQKTLSTGWNLIGAIGIATETSAINATPGSLSGPLYCYNPDAYAYSRAAMLEPGRGYWASAATPCTINVSITPPAAPQ